MIGTAQTFTADERREYIGCSEMAAVLGLDRYKTPLDLYNEKLGLVPAFEGNAHTTRGNRLEAIAADYYTELTGHKLRRHTTGFVHPEFRFIRGHVDRFVVGERRIVEVKCPSIAAFRRFQRQGLPESYIIQANAYAGLAGIPKLTYAIFCADVWDLASFDVEFDDAIFRTTIDAVVSFWQKHVLPGIPPLETAEKPKFEFEKFVGDITFRDDQPWTEAVQLLREADQLKRDGEMLFDLAKAKVVAAIEEAEGVYEGAGLRLHYKSQEGRKTFDQKLLAKEHPSIDLNRYEKRGLPFKTFKPVWLRPQE
jgi:putative phage-type endonuclease